MKIWAGALLAAGLAAIAYSFSEPSTNPVAAPKDAPWALVVGGDTDGYLSPCGCTYPMTGGIRRRATAIRALGAKYRLAVIDDGGLGGEPGQQSEMKAQTMAQSLDSLDAAAIHLTARDARLGRGTLDQISRLSGERLVSSDVAIPGVKPFVHRGPFEIGGYSKGLGDAVGAPEASRDETVGKLLATAEFDRAIPVLMLDGGRDEAAEVAEKYPKLAAVVYRRQGWPPDKADKVGPVWLLTPGERGKSVVQVVVKDGALTGYLVTRLGPQFADDPTVSRYYRTYLQRLDEAHLLENLPREPSAAFAGSEKCGSCHAAAYKIWHASGHAHAYTTLEGVGHQRDPDCVSCHVVGQQAYGGFRSRADTPSLAAVGCESCHGPGDAHSQNPKVAPLAKLGQEICLKCHNSEQSPGFRFLTFWPKVSHR